ncbi:MAG: hypothetical protein VX737_04435 [Pseudomonadota bacterium]|nr:hypothetical protein [Pseudomonadota bacterium]
MFTLFVYCENQQQAQAWMEFLSIKSEADLSRTRIENNNPILTPQFEKVIRIDMDNKKDRDQLLSIVTEAAYSPKGAWSGAVDFSDKGSAFFRPRGYINDSFNYLTEYLIGQVEAHQQAQASSLTP